MLRLILVVIFGLYYIKLYQNSNLINIKKKVMNLTDRKVNRSLDYCVRYTNFKYISHVSIKSRGSENC